jgi:hypothetical protein
MTTFDIKTTHKKSDLYNELIERLENTIKETVSKNEKNKYIMSDLDKIEWNYAFGTVSSLGCYDIKKIYESFIKNESTREMAENIFYENYKHALKLRKNPEDDTKLSSRKEVLIANGIALKGIVLLLTQYKMFYEKTCEMIERIIEKGTKECLLKMRK